MSVGQMRICERDCHATVVVSQRSRPPLHHCAVAQWDVDIWGNQERIEGSSVHYFVTLFM